MTTTLSPRMGDPAEPFGRYRLLKKLGQGGMGVVYLAHDPDLNRLVALKVPLDASGAEAAERFRRAARAAASLHHPNICPLHEAGVIDGVPYLTMAYIDGTTLAERLRLGRLSAAEAAALVRIVALALAEAHDCGVIHRDLKPSNILINRRGEPILTDFGLASIGTPAYAPPKSLHGDARASDIYSLGVVLCELLTGRPAFDEGAALDPRFDAVLRRATAGDPADRYPDMAAFAAALAPLAADHDGRKEESWSLPLSTSGEDNPLSGGEKATKCPTRPWRLIAGGAVCAAVAIGSFYTLTQLGYMQNPAAAPANGGAPPSAAEALRRRLDSVQALVRRGRTEYRQGADAAADADFEEVFQRSMAGAADAPRQARDYADRAWCYGRIDRREEALADCAAALRLDAGCTAAWLLSAQVWHDCGRRDLEQTTYADAWNAVRPASAEQCADLARIALALDRPDDALRCCEDALRRDPRLPDAYEVRAQARLRKRDRDGAAADFARAADLMNPHWARDYVERSVLRELAGDADRALADADRALALAPRLPAALRQRGAALRAGKDRPRAIADYRTAAAALAPRFAADYFDRAWLLNELGDYRRAAADLERALALGLRSGEVHRELAHARRNLKEYDQAAVHLNAALRLLPGDALLSGERAALSLARGRWGDAVQAYGVVLAQNPDDAVACASRGDALFQTADYEGAVADYTRALAHTAPTDRAGLADGYDRRGVAFARLGKYAEAAADYSRAIDNDPTDPVLYRNRAAARLRAGDEAAAEADERKAEELQAAP